MISYSDLQNAFNYDECTGIFTWKNDNGRKIKKGMIAGSKNKEGYVFIKYKGKTYSAHRLAWIYVNKTLPESNIDHVNNIKFDNRISNLRLANKSENAMNRSSQKNSKTGIKGVSITLNGRYMASAERNGKKITKRFSCISDAKVWIDLVRKDLHGEFCNNI